MCTKGRGGGVGGGAGTGVLAAAGVGVGVTLERPAATVGVALFRPLDTTVISVGPSLVRRCRFSRFSDMGKEEAGQPFHASAGPATARQLALERRGSLARPAPLPR